MARRSWVRDLLGQKPLVRPSRRQAILANCSRSAIEALERRVLLTAAPSATLQLIPASGSSLPAVTLGLDSYQFGFKNSSTLTSLGSGAGAGKTTFDDLEVSTPLNEASPQLLKVLVTGNHYDTAVLTQRDAASNPLAQWVLAGVFMSSDSIQSDSAAVPGEDLHFVFQSLTEVTSSHSASWSQTLADFGTPAASTGVTLTPIPPVSAPSVTLDLGSGATAITLGLNSYQFDFENVTSIGSASSGAGAGKAKLNALQVSALFSEASPQLFKTLVAGSHLDTAVLTQRDAAGRPVAQWVLNDVLVTSDSIAGAGAGVPAETLTLDYAALAEVTADHATSWNQGENSNNGPTPTGVALSELPSRVAQALTLDLQPSGSSSLAAVTLGLDSYQFGFENTTTIGSATSGAGAGKSAFEDLVVSTSLSDSSPQLLAALVTGNHYDTAVLTQRNAAGDPVAQWVLGTIFLSSDGIAGGRGAVVPAETLHLAFGSVNEATAGHNVSWSAITNSNGGPQPTGVPLAPLPTVAAPAITLELQQPVDPSLSGVTLNLNSYLFGFKNPATIGSTTSGAGAGKATFDALDVTTLLSDASPQLLQSLVTGGHFDTAVLTQRDAAGHPVAQWVLGKAFLTSDGIESQSTAVPAEDVHIIFGSVTEVTAGQSTSWDQLNNSSGQVAPPPTVPIAPLPAVAAPALTLDLHSPDPSLPAVTLDLNAYQFGFANSATISSATGGAGAGKATFDDLLVSALLSDASPELLKVLVTGNHFDTAVLTQRDAAGNPLAQWVLGTILLSSDGIAGNGAAAPTESLDLRYGSVTELTAGHAASWDRTLNSVGNPAAPTGVTLAPLPTASAPALTLDLTDSSLPTLTVALNSYQLGFEQPTNIGSASSGAGAGKAKFDDLIISEALSEASPQLFKSLVTGQHYRSAVLTQRNAAGDPVAQWVMGNLIVTSDAIAGSGPAVPAETLHLKFASVTEVTADQTASWNQTTNSNDGSTSPTGVALAPLGVTTPSVTVTDAGGVYNGATFAVTAATVRAGGITLASLGSPSLSFTYYVGSTASGPGSTTAPTNAGTYTVVAHFTSSNPGLYTSADSAPVVFAITPAPLVITVDSKSRVYGQANPPLTGTVSGVLNSDNVTVTYATAATPSSDVRAGGYAITASALAGAAAANYSFDPTVAAGAAVTGGTLTITSAPLTITANNQTKIKGEANPPFTVRYNGLVLGQTAAVLGGTLAFTAPATATSPPGNYAITPRGQTSGNYAISFVSGTLTIISPALATGSLLLQVITARLPLDTLISLASPILEAIESFSRGKDTSGANQLSAFIKHVAAQKGKKIDAALADTLTAAAQRIINAVS